MHYTNDDVFRRTDQSFTDDELAAWLEDDDNAAWYNDDRTTQPPPGQGKFFIKVGSRAGIPFSMEFTPTERRSRVHDTEKKWHTAKAKAAEERRAVSSLDRKHTAGLGGEAALLVVLLVLLVGVPGGLYGLNTLGHQI